MKIGREPPSKSNAHPNREANPTLIRTRDKVREVTKNIPQAFTAGKVHFSKLKPNRSSHKTSSLFAQKMNTFNS